jgi:DNA-binding FadR family transcriptional regulator
MRAALEGTAAALAAQHATNAEVQRLFQIAKSEARAKNDPAKLVIINGGAPRSEVARPGA